MANTEAIALPPKRVRQADLATWPKFELSAAAWYRAHGVSQRTFYDACRRALAQVAEGLNRHGEKVG